ncbi:MAG: hypothetical protein RL141_502 [Candidatus Parcubacteria bacterium]|jgi:hypothetical protein
MIFVKFTLLNSEEGAVDYLVGASLRDVLTDAENVFSNRRIESHQVITEEEVRALNLEHFEQGIRCVRDEGVKCFYIGYHKPH